MPAQLCMVINTTYVFNLQCVRPDEDSKSIVEVLAMNVFCQMWKSKSVIVALLEEVFPRSHSINPQLIRVLCQQLHCLCHIGRVEPCHLLSPVEEQMHMYNTTPAPLPLLMVRMEKYTYALILVQSEGTLSISLFFTSTRYCQCNKTS